MTAPHSRPMMKCGHAANGTKVVIQMDVGPGEVQAARAPIPCCVICAPAKEAYEVDENPPDLRTREARCPSCDARRPSSPSLPFFDYQGPGSRYDLDNPSSKVLDKYRTKGGRPFDEFYCGCRGWD